MKALKTKLALIAAAGVLTACAGMSGSTVTTKDVPKLQSGEWAVQSINGKPVTTPMSPTLNFGPTFQLTGHTSCNSYFSGYVLSGSSIVIKQAGSTKMACEPTAMDQEDRFLKQLSNTQIWSIDTNGTLTLSGPSGSIVAKRK